MSRRKLSILIILLIFLFPFFFGYTADFEQYSQRLEQGGPYAQNNLDIINKNTIQVNGKQFVTPGVVDKTLTTPSTVSSTATTDVDSLSLIPTPDNAGGDPCRVGTASRMHLIPKEQVRGSPTIEIGFGKSGGLAVWQIENGKVYTQRVDVAGVPIGQSQVFDAPKKIILRQVQGLTDGFLIIAKDFSDFEFNAWFIWTTDAIGKILERMPLNIGNHHFEDIISPVVNDRVLFYLGNDRLKNKNSSRVILLSVANGEINQQIFDFPVVIPPYKQFYVEPALGEKDWAVWVYIPEQQVAYLLGPNGHVTAEKPLFPMVLLTNYLMRYDETDTLRVLTQIGEDDRDNIVVMWSEEGDMSSTNEQATSSVMLRYDTFAVDGTVKPGDTFRYTPSATLPVPFTNELDFTIGTKVANRMTIIRLHRIGAPISLESVQPTISDPFLASAAWSSTHWVIAYWNESPVDVTMNVIGIRCGS